MGPGREKETSVSFEGRACVMCWGIPLSLPLSLALFQAQATAKVENKLRAQRTRATLHASWCQPSEPPQITSNTVASGAWLAEP